MRTYKGIEPTRDKSYLKWIKEELPCSICGDRGEAHHLIGHGMSGMATKTSDLFTMPLCRNHHNKLHEGYHSWENMHGSQVYHVARTMLLAITKGRKTKADFQKEIENHVVNQLDRDMFNEWLL